jgi:hypothetical protein
MHNCASCCRVLKSTILGKRNWAHHEQADLLLKRAALSRPSGEWNDDDFDVLADGVIVGRILNGTRRRTGHVKPFFAQLADGDAS